MFSLLVSGEIKVFQRDGNEEDLVMMSLVLLTLSLRFFAAACAAAKARSINGDQWLVCLSGKAVDERIVVTLELSLTAAVAAIKEIGEEMSDTLLLSVFDGYLGVTACIRACSTANDIRCCIFFHRCST